MPGVPDFLEITFGDYEGSDLKIMSDPADSLNGKTVLIRISKAHYRHHEFVIKDCSRNFETGKIHNIRLERKDLKPGQIGETSE
jgi:hypothetical protein